MEVGHRSLLWGHDTQHNDTQHNDAQHKGLVHDIQNKWQSITTLYHYAECRILIVAMLSVVMLSDVMLSVVILSVFMLRVSFC
jgi:hypothetical protein